jgi:hypothetical protein
VFSSERFREPVRALKVAAVSDGPKLTAPASAAFMSTMELWRAKVFVRRSVPAELLVVPVKVFAAERVTEPAPSFVMGRTPLMTPVMFNVAPVPALRITVVVPVLLLATVPLKVAVPESRPRVCWLVAPAVGLFVILLLKVTPSKILSVLEAVLLLLSVTVLPVPAVSDEPKTRVPAWTCTSPVIKLASVMVTVPTLLLATKSDAAVREATLILAAALEAWSDNFPVLSVTLPKLSVPRLLLIELNLLVLVPVLLMTRSLLIV